MDLIFSCKQQALLFATKLYSNLTFLFFFYYIITTSNPYPANETS